MGLAKDMLTVIEIMIKRDALMDKELLDAASVDDNNELLADQNYIKLECSERAALDCNATPCDVCGKDFTTVSVCLHISVSVCLHSLCLTVPYLCVCMSPFSVSDCPISLCLYVSILCV